MEAPFEIHGVSNSYFSVSRYYGGCRFNGYYYVYDPRTDVLIREDIFKQRAKEAKESAKKKRTKKPDNPSLFEK